MNNDIRGGALLVRLSISKFAPTRRDKSATSEVLVAKQASRGAAEVRKRLLPKEAVDPVLKVEREIRATHYTHTLPWDDEGLRLLPVDNWATYVDEMQALRVRWDNRVDEFIDSYEDYRQQAMADLGLLFDASDYPAAGEVRGKFIFDTMMYPLPSGDDFRLHMQDDDLDELRSKLDQRVNSAVDEARLDLYNRLAERLNRVSERLSDPDHVFRDSLIEGLQDLLHLIPNLNVTKDPELEELRLETLRRVAPHAAQDLRDDDTLRDQVKNAADEILRKMGLAPA